MGLVAGRDVLGLDGPGIAPVAAAVELGVGVQRFGPPAGDRKTDPVPGALNRGEVQDDDHMRIPRAAAAQPGEDLVLDRVDGDPLEALGVAVADMQRRLCPVQPGEVADQ